MQATRRRDTAPELALRRELHRRGLRYRVDVVLPVLPRRRMDIVFSRARVVVLVDGCFWHGCPTHGTVAQQNAAFWAAKILANRARDADTDERLRRDGWEVLRVWEHEAPDRAALRIAEAVFARRAASGTAPRRGAPRGSSRDGWGSHGDGPESP